MHGVFPRGNILVGIPTRMQVSHGRENLPGQYARVTGTPARFILRLGWAETVATGPGCLATSWPSQPGQEFATLLHFQNPPSD